jgi:hypothetical protein
VFHRGANLGFFTQGMVAVFVDFSFFGMKTMDSLAVLDLFLYICGLVFAFAFLWHLLRLI